jgi:tetratricopeptide (TPR) repeat protein
MRRWRGSVGRTLRSGCRSGLALSLLLFPLTANAQPERRAALDTFNAANAAYSAGNYRTAAPLYEQVVAALPDQPIAYLYLGNCYDHMSLDAPRGSQQLIDLLKKAEAAYKTGADKMLATNTPAATRNAVTILEMQAGLYAPDRLHDTATAIAVTQHLIRLNPSDPAYEFTLATLEENVENYDAAESALAKALELKPNDAHTLADVAGHYWDIAAHGRRLTYTRETAYLQKGMAFADNALALDAQNADATAYKSQLLREQAALETDRKRKDALNKEADAWAAKAKALRAK